MEEQNIHNFEPQENESVVPSPDCAGEEVTVEVDSPESEVKVVKKKKVLVIAIIAVALIAIAVACIFIIKNMRYSKAFDLINDGEYEEAYKIFNNLGNFKDSKEQLERFKYVPVNIVIEYGDTRLSQSCKFDSDGNVIEEIYKFHDRKNIIYYTYDVEGRLTKKNTQIYFDEINRSDRLDEYKYDGENLIQEKCYYKDLSNSYLPENRIPYELHYAYEYSYDAKGNEIQRIYTDYEINIQNIYDYTYDKNGNLIKEIYTTNTGEISTDEYTYDVNGNEIKQISTNSQGETTIYESTYDKNGNLIKTVVTEKNGNVRTNEFAYDEYGNLTKWNWSGFERIVEYEYDEDNRIVEIEGDVYVYVFIYDEFGNLTEIVEKRKNNADYKTEWEIEYEMIYFSDNASKDKEELMTDFMNSDLFGRVYSWTPHIEMQLIFPIIWVGSN